MPITKSVPESVGLNEIKAIELESLIGWNVMVFFCSVFSI
ncbi:hypothetical protein C4J98_2888 [Pseudomonas orientalis]|nr:hypothetical protein C4J98_2888 [Pseudomonas orientalis]